MAPRKGLTGIDWVTPVDSPELANPTSRWSAHSLQGKLTVGQRNFGRVARGHAATWRCWRAFLQEYILSSESEGSADEEDQDLDRLLADEAGNAVVPPWNQMGHEVTPDHIDRGLFRHRYSSMYHLAANEGGASWNRGADLLLRA